MSKILITAFEPFGLIGKFVRGENTSQKILEGLRAAHPDRFLFKTLPVSQDAVTQLHDLLEKERPSGILAMGEHLFVSPKEVKIEPYALNTPASPFPDLTIHFKDKVSSAFVNQLGLGETGSSIGNYYCNQIYLEGLNWAQQNGNVPVAFIHTPVLGDHQRHGDQVLKILEKMQAYSNTIRPEP